MGLAMFLPSSAGAVPCGASVMTTLMCIGSSNASTWLSDPAMLPNICRTMSESRSPSRLRVGMTSALPLCFHEESQGSVDQLRVIPHVGCRAAAASSSSLNMPSYTGLTVYLGPPKTCAGAVQAGRKTPPRSGRSPGSPSKSGRRSRHRPPSSRATLWRHRHRPRPCGRWRSANARLPPGARAGCAVRSAGSPSRRSPPAGWRLGCRHRSSGGVMVAAFIPSPDWFIAAAASCTTAFFVARRFSRLRSKCWKFRSSSITCGPARAAPPAAALRRSGHRAGRQSYDH